MKFPEFSELRKDASGKYHIATDEFDRTRAVGETDSAYEKRIDSINWAEFNKRAEESKKNDYANAIDYAKSQGSDRKTYTVDEAIKVSTNATKNLTDDQRSLIREYNNLPSYNRQYKKDDIKNSFIESGMDEEEFLKLAQYQGYLDDIEETNSMKEKISSDIKDNDKAWLNALKFKAVDAVSSLAGGVAAVGETINKKTNQYADEKMPINTYSDAYKILNYNDAAKEAVNEQIKSNFYDTAKTLGFSDSVADKASFLAGKSDEIVNIIAENLLPARAFGYLVNGALGATKLSESLVKQLVTSQFFALGFSEGIKESEERGLDESETLKTATVNGFAEYIGEQIGFDSMNKIIFGEVTEGTAKAIIKSAADDAEGEILTDVINDFGDLFINSDKSKLAQSVYDYEEDGNSHNKALALTLRDTLLSYAETGVTSLIATGVGAGIQSGITHMAENRSNKRAGNYAASNPEAIINMLSDDRSNYRTDAEFEQAQNAILNSIDASGETLSKSEIKDLGSQVREAYQSQERAKLDAVRNATTPYEMKKASEILNSDSDEANRAKLYAKKRLLDAGFTADDIEKTHTAASLYNAAASGEEISDDIINSFPVEDREEALKALESGRKINTLKTKEGAAIDATNSEAVVVDFTKAVTKENGNILVYDSNGNTHATNTLESVGLTGYALKLATSLNDETAVNNLFNYLSKNSAVSKKALLNNVKKIVSAARMDLSFEAFDKKYSKVFNTKDAKELFDSIENISKDTFKRTNEAKKGKGKVNKERLTTSEGKAAYESMTKGSKNLLNLMAIKLKVDFELFYDESETRGEYIPEEGKITINLKYNRDILSVAMHEGIGEFLQAHAGDKYDVVARHVLEYFYNKSEDALKTTIDAYLKAYIEDGQLDYNVRAAANEFVNDKLGEIFSTEEGINNFIAWLKTADEFKVTANTFRQYFEDLKSWIKEVAASTINHSTLNFNKAEKEADKLSKMFLDAMDEAIKNRDLASDSLEKLQNANIEIDEESGTISKSLNVTIKESYKDLKYDSYDEAINDIAESISKNVKGVTKTQAKKWLLDQESQAASMFLNDEFLYYTNFEFDENYKAIKSDADYKQGTADFSNLCRKRELFTKLFDNLQFSHPDFIFSADDIAEIRNIMTESDLEVACALCYVEDRRQKTGEIAQNFIDEYKNALNSKDKQIRWNNSSGKRKILSNKTVAKKYKVSDFNFKANDSYVPNQADLTTYKGFAELRKNHKEIAAAFQAFNNARGMSAARLIEGHAEYKREILKYSDKRVKMINNLGGLRIFSFSDFESIHLIDLVQVITDCSAKGIKIQAYTKVPAFAKLIANTSVKLNRSLIPATASSKNAYARIKNASGGYEFINVTSDDRGIADINGVEYLAFDTVEGIDVNSKYFEDTSNNPDVGNILIGINDHQTRLAMVDPFIDYIIGFHSNQASSTLEKKGISHWSNYKKQVDKDGNEYFQEETYLPDHKKSQKNRINIYTDVLKKHKVTNKVDFVNAFLDECKKNSLKPRFSQFLDKDADGNYIYTEGYHKLLLDFKLFDMDGNILPQKVVKPDFDVALMNEILLEDAKKERDLSFPKEILDKVENRVINKPRKSLDVKPNAPVFYSKLINEIDAMKQDKISAASVVSFLKGKGVKDDEIKWSGIETFLEGKKSVSKEELLAFAKENELSLEEKILTDSIQDKVNELTNMLDELEASYSLDDWIEPMDESFNNFRFQIDMQDLLNDGEVSESDYDKLLKMGNSLLAAENKNTHWSEYKVEGATNYREILFKLPDSEYSNNAMKSHWGESGVIAHARIDDIELDDGKMLFVEEIQSDWHNHGQKEGYVNEYSNNVDKIIDLNTKRHYLEEDFYSKMEDAIGSDIEKLGYNAPSVIWALSDGDIDLESALRAKGLNLSKVSDIVYKFKTESEDITNQIKELKEAKNSAPDAPFKNTYTDYVMKRILREAAENGYDYIGWTTGKMQEDRWSSDFSEGYRIEYDQNIPKFMNKYVKKWGAKVEETSLGIYESYEDGNRVYSVRITPEMKESVLKKGQPRFSLNVDTEGNKLTSDQIDYFKDSKAVDSNGNLLVLYHGTNAEFYEFDYKFAGKNGRQEGFGIYTTDDPEVAAVYGNAKKLYANIKKPFSGLTITLNKSDIKKLVKLGADFNAKRWGEDLKDGWLSNYEDTYSTPISTVIDKVADNYFRYNETDNDIIQGMIHDMSIYDDPEIVHEFYNQVTNALGYDGIITEWENRDGGKNAKIVIAFDSNQLKEVTNEHPTKNPDIRKSLNVDSEYLELAKEPKKNASKLKKMVEDAAKAAGYNVHAYHGTMADYFTVFDTYEVDSNMGSHFGSKEIAEGFASDMYGHGNNRGRVLEVFLKANNPYKTYDWFAQDDFYPAKEAKNLADKIGTKEAYKIVDEIKALSPEIAAAMEDIDELEEGYLDSDEERKVLYGGLRKLLKLAGYDSILYENGLEIVGEWDYIIQDANQIKLADPVTYDDNGNIIPLSERFDSNNNDIRKSLNVLSDDSPFKEAYKKMDAAEALVKKLKIHVVEGKKLKKENLDKLKFALIGKYNLSFDVAFVNELTDDLKKFDSYMRSEDISYDVMMDYAMQIADEIREKSHFFVGGSNLDNDLVIAFELIDNYFSAVKKQNQPKVDPKTQSDLKDTIEEYKKNLEKQYKERVIDIAQKYEEALKRERGTQNLSKSDKQKVKEMAQTKAKEQFNSMKEAEQKAKDKEAIIRTCTRLINWMNAPTDQKHVPIFLKEPLVDVIASINFMPQSLVKDMNATTKAALRWTSSMNKLKDVIQAIKNASDPSLDYKEVEKAQMYSLSLVMEAENLFTEMSKFIDEHNGVANLSDLDAKAMHELARFLNTISHAVNKMNSTFMNTRFESIDDLGKATIKEMNDLKPVFNETSNPMKPMMHEFLNVAMLEPISFFEEFGEASSTIMQEFFDGEKIGIEIIREAENFFTDLSDRLLITQKDTKNWSKELHTFKVEGKDITLSTSDIMSLYASNEQERRAQEKDPTTATYHIMAGGIKTKPKKVNFNKTINYNPQVYHPAKSDLNTIFEVLSDTQKEYIDAVVSYMSNTLSRHGNETSNILYGYDKFTADYYYPLKTDTDTIATNEGNAQTAQVAMRALINPSFTKTRLNKADNALVVYDFFDVVTDHIKGMANYCAYSQAVSDALRWYNYAPTTRTNLENQDDWRRDTFTVKAAMVSVKGTKSKEYFETLLRDINLDNNVKGSAFQDKLIGMVKAQAVTANVRVVLSQPTSITRALKYLGHDNIAKGFSYVLAHPVEAVKYAQDTNYLCYWKSKGFSDYRIAQGMKEIILGSDNRVQGLVEKLGVPAGVADDITWAAMYKASEYKIKKDKPNLDEADYRKAVDNLFSDIINHTQVIDSTLRKTQENRNKSALVKMANAFMNEPQKSYNMLHRAYFNYVQANDMQKANAKKELKDQIAIFAYNALVVAAVQAVIDALRDDSDDKFFDKFLKMLFPVEAIDTIKSAIEDGTFNGWTLLEIYGQMGNFVDNLNPLNMLPYFSEISNIAKGYDSTRMDTQLFTQVGETLEKLRSESTTTYGKLYSIAKTLSMATSIPFANILREIKVINNNFVYKLTDKKWYQSKTSETKAIKAKEERELSEVIDTNDLSKTKEYINSLFDSYISQGLDESESYSKIRDRLKVQYQNRLGKEDEATLDNRFRVLLKQTKYKNASKNSYSPMSDKKINETLKKWKEK